MRKFRDSKEPKNMSDAMEKNEKDQGAVAVAPKEKAKKAEKPKVPGLLPQWRVLLHNDDKNEITFVIVTIMELTPLNQDAAIKRTEEAHKKGIALLLVTHKELAELYQEQFQSKGLTVTIEPAE